MATVPPPTAPGTASALLFVLGHVAVAFMLAALWGYYFHVYAPSHAPLNTPFLAGKPLDLSQRPSAMLANTPDLRLNPDYKKPLTSEQLGAWSVHCALLFGGLVAYLRLLRRPGSGVYAGTLLAGYLAGWGGLTLSGMAPDTSVRTVASLVFATLLLVPLALLRALAARAGKAPP